MKPLAVMHGESQSRYIKTILSQFQMMGRGMPVDQHKGEKVSAVEVILTRLHAGGKFSDKSYTFSGGLHGVGVSVVNALSSSLEVKVKRNGKEFAMRFRDGVPTGPLKPVGKVGARNTGTTIQFWPDPIFFDSPSISVSRLKRLLRAKAVLCSGLRIDFFDQANKKNDESWEYEDGLLDYLVYPTGQFGAGARSAPCRACHAKRTTG